MNSSAGSFKATEIKAAAESEAKEAELTKSIQRPKSNPRLLKPLANNNINVSDQLHQGVAVLKKCKEAKRMMQQINKDIKLAASEMETGYRGSDSILNELNNAFTSTKTDAEI